MIRKIVTTFEIVLRAVRLANLKVSDIAAKPRRARTLAVEAQRLAPRRRERAKNGVKWAKFGGETAEKQRWLSGVGPSSAATVTASGGRSLTFWQAEDDCVCDGGQPTSIGSQAAQDLVDSLVVATCATTAGLPRIGFHDRHSGIDLRGAT